MISKWPLFGIFICLLFACKDNVHNAAEEELTGAQLYKAAAQKVGGMEFDSALVLLNAALEEGIKRPMQIVTDSNFYALIDSAAYRPIIRSLLDNYATEHRAIIIRENEEGDPIIVHGKIIDESTNIPLNNVKIELVQADNDGFYFEENSNWNPRIFAYLLSDDKGAFEITTIRPGRYKDDDGNEVSAHIHFTLQKDGFKVYGGEFTFKDDAVFIQNKNVEQNPVATLIDSKTPKQYQVNIPMQRK